MKHFKPSLAKFVAAAVVMIVMRLPPAGTCILRRISQCSRASGHTGWKLLFIVSLGCDADSICSRLPDVSLLPS